MVLAGGGSNGGRATVSAGGSSPASSAVCSIYDSGTNALITVLQGSSGECQALAQQLSSAGSFWTAQPQQPDEAQSMVCVMEDSSGDVAR